MNGQHLMWTHTFAGERLSYQVAKLSHDLVIWIDFQMPMMLHHAVASLDTKQWHALPLCCNDMDPEIFVSSSIKFSLEFKRIE